MFRVGSSLIVFVRDTPFLWSQSCGLERSVRPCNVEAAISGLARNRMFQQRITVCTRVVLRFDLAKYLSS